MANNITIKDGSSADQVVATKEVGGVDFQQVMLATPAGAELSPLTDAELRATPIPVSVSGAATSAKQDTGNTSLASVDTKLTGVATSAKQDTGNAALVNIDTKLAPADDTVIYVGGVALTPKFAKIAATQIGDNTLVAAVTSKKIRVLAYNLMGAGAVNAKFQTGASGTDLTGLKYIAAAGMGICAPFNPVGWFETASGALLNLSLSAGVGVGGELVYIEV